MENEKEVSILKVAKKIFPMIMKSCPILCTIVLLTGVLHGGSYVLQTNFNQKFFDQISMIVNGNASISNGIIMAIILGIVIIAVQILNGVDNFLASVFLNKVIGKINKMINDKVGVIDPISFEHTELLDSINKAKKGAESCSVFFLVVASLLTFYIPYFLIMGIYLFKLDKILTLSLFIIFIPVVLTQVIRVKIFYKLEDEVAPIRREYEYYEKAICDREYFKETRILGAFNYFYELYSISMRVFGGKSWNAERKSGFLELYMKLITLLGYLGTLFLLIRSLFKGNITIGAFSAIFASISFMIEMMEEIICTNIGSITMELGSIKNFIDFLAIPERKGCKVDINGDNGIVLKNVTFMYPSRKEPSIKNINLKINANETIAIVGENGSGKSTLVKLIMGLYLPTEGNVLFGDINISNVCPKSIYKYSSAVFQKYQRYKMKLKENIMISNMEFRSEEFLNKCLEKSDINIKNKSFPLGVDTVLSREFDGVDLSGGQWQKVAIGRGFYKNYKLIILDEPTASIDPVEETKIYERFVALSKGKTSVIVTHRLGSARIADRIIVMDNGEIAEIGTHEELLLNNGKYSKMYNEQAQWYIR